MTDRRMSLPIRLACLVLALFGFDARGQAPTSPGSLFDAKLAEVRRASEAWAQRRGPTRAVVDVVCLVPDVPTFFEAIAAWDRDHWFPILIDDVDSNARFLRTFRPARVVRYPSKAAAIPAERTWEAARSAVSAAWAEPQAGPADQVDAGRIPSRYGATPPGLVASEPDSPALAGAVALAAGRFQPLIRWDVAKRFDDRLGLEEAGRLLASLEARVAEVAEEYSKLGDDCDFITLAGDYPYRYNGPGGPFAVDDLLARGVPGLKRWAYVGRLLGDPAPAVDRAMCSLFLRPGSALLFNTYDEKSAPWSAYQGRTGASLLAGLMPVTQLSGAEADLADWHHTLDPTNGRGLVLVNTQGSPTSFGIGGGEGQAGDIPPTVPTAVYMLHSYSAADPNDVDTLAGRWLAQGAFAYFGSMDEPFLTSFRTPTLIGSLLAEGLPMVVAFRQMPGEAFANPWKLVHLGDPLDRIEPAPPPARLARWAPVDAWPAYRVDPPPTANANDETRLAWALRAAIASAGRGTVGPDLAAPLLAIRRDRLPTNIRPVFDSLLAGTLYRANRRAEARARIGQIPQGERSPALRAILESCWVVDFQAAVTAKDYARVRTIWDGAIRAGLSRELKERFTKRAGALAEGPLRLADWRVRLRATLRDLANAPEAAIIRPELDRVEADLDIPPGARFKSGGAPAG